MAVVGRKPKPEDQRRNKVQPRHDWLDVLDEPYNGTKPALTIRRKATVAWWEAVSSMPHCIIWTPTDWQFALDTARIHSAFVGGDLARAGELRLRENQMGTTFDALRDLRIRYVAGVAAEEEKPTAIDEYRKALNA